MSYALPGRSQASLISGGHPGDRFVLALLRAVADAVIVGAGTLRSEPGVIWSSESVFPEAGDAFAQVRARMGLPARALTVLVTRSGKIDLRAPALREGVPVLILTTAAGATALGGVPGHVRVRTMTQGTGAEMIRVAAEESGGRLLLTEGGPTLFGQLVRERVVDELFLTVAPLLTGRAKDAPRLSLVAEMAFTPEDAPKGRLVSAKTADDYLFLRYAMAAP